MAHEWHPYEPEDKLKAIASTQHRICYICDKRQSLQAKQSWGRVVGYQWLPLAGRCIHLKSKFWEARATT